MKVTGNTPWKWSADIGYSQGIKFIDATASLMYSGQGSIDERGTPVHINDMRAQIKLSLENISAVLFQSDMGFQNVMRLVIYTTDMGSTLQNFDLIKHAFQGQKHKPTMSLIGVTSFAHPDMLIELEATAYH